jgi:plastocyanin
MDKFGVSQTDLQEALRTTNFSDYTKFGLTHGMGLQELNLMISDWVEKNPYATNDQIQAAMKKAGINDQDIERGLNALSASAGKEYAIINDMGLDQLYKNILDYQAAGHSPAEVAAVMAKYGIEQRDINKANKYAADTGYKANPTSYAGIGDYSNLGGGSSIVNDTVVASGNTGAVNNAAVSSGLDKSNEIYQYFANPETQAALASGNTRGVAETMQELGYSPADVAAATGTNVADVQAAYDAALSQGSASSSNSTASSSNEIYDYFASPEVQSALASGDTRGIAETMQARGYSPAEVAAATGTNVADVQAAYDAALGIGQQDSYLYAATGGYLGYADGGEIAMAKGRYLQGGTDGMADELPARIGKDQPAALSHGEFVIPADVVSHMGNGNSDAGAKKLYQMMDKIRMARTGNKKQGKKINPDKFMPGGLASAYAKGGSVKHFVTGGSTVPAGTTGVESSLSNYAGPYVTNMLGQGQALANMPYQAYMGPLTAGESPLQTDAFNTAGGLATPAAIGNAATTAGGIATKAADLTYKPTTSAFDATQAQAYMNPYLQASLNPQLEEARRQSQITQTQNAGKMTQAGAFGGGRQAILDAETQRSLGANLANITGSGYNTAYDKAMAQFNADQARKAQESQFGATYGLQGLQTGLQAAQAQGGLGATQASTGLANLNAQLDAGRQQRGIESEGIAADKAQFEEARANPYKMLQYQQSLLQGLPLEAKNYTGIQQSDLVKAAQGASTVAQLLKNLGISS